MSIKLHTIEVKNCARCQGAHGPLQFTPFTTPPQDGTNYTHFATCPTNGEPILLKFEDMPLEKAMQQLEPGRYMLRKKFKDEDAWDLELVSPQADGDTEWGIYGVTLTEAVDAALTRQPL